jgi:hypothetical protein
MPCADLAVRLSACSLVLELHENRTERMTESHRDKCVYPLGYHATRIYWSYRRPRERVVYTMSVAVDTKVHFVAVVFAREFALFVRAVSLELLVHPANLTLFLVVISLSAFNRLFFTVCCPAGRLLACPLSIASFSLCVVLPTCRRPAWIATGTWARRGRCSPSWPPTTRNTPSSPPRPSVRHSSVPSFREFGLRFDLTGLCGWLGVQTPGRR